MLQTAEIFQNNMVLQRGENIRIFGKAEPGVHVLVEIQGQAVEDVADKNGVWMALVPVLEASERESLTVTDGQNSIRYENVAVGEVWIAGGQSNMEFWLRYEKHRRDSKVVTENPRVRFFDVPKIAFDGQRELFDYHNVGVWRSATEDNLDYFSAVGYYFACELERELNIPVGIVGCNWGGTTSSVWMSRKTLEQVGSPWLDEYESKISSIDMARYWEEERHNIANDTGNAVWNPFNEFILPQTPPVEAFGSFFAGMLPPGAIPQGEDAADIQGADLQEIMAVYLQRLKVQEIPACLYEHMVKTIGGFTVRGVLWYQGESDDVPGRQAIYRDMMAGLIEDWRMLWQQELPFLIVQLPGYGSWLTQTPFDYITIRQQQEQLCDSVPGTYLCSISDAGDEFDIHPKDKLVVGKRLAILALGNIYGEVRLADAPRLVSAVKGEDSIVLNFINAGDGLIAEENELPLKLEMDGKELPFTFELRDDQLLLHTNERLTNIVTVSFAWENWFRVTLYNSTHIPAIPFRVNC